MKSINLHIKKFILFVCLFSSIIFPMRAYATNQTNTTVYEPNISTSDMDIGSATEGKTENELKQFLVGENGLMLFVSRAGLILIAFGIGQILLALKDDNADAKSKGIMILLGGVFCFTISALLTMLGVDF